MQAQMGWTQVSIWQGRINVYIQYLGHSYRHCTGQGKSNAPAAAVIE